MAMKHYNDPAPLTPQGAVLCPESCECDRQNSITRNANAGRLCPRLTPAQHEGFTYGGVYFTPYRKYEAEEKPAYKYPKLYKPFATQPEHWNYSQFYGTARDNKAGDFDLYLAGGYIVAPTSDYLAHFGFDLAYLPHKERIAVDYTVNSFAFKFITENNGNPRRLFDLGDANMAKTFEGCAMPLDYAYYALCRASIADKLIAHPFVVAANLAGAQNDSPYEVVNYLYFDWMDGWEEDTAERYLNECHISRWQYNTWCNRNWRGDK